MREYIGLDVSMKDTAVSIRRDGQRIWGGNCPSDPQLIAEVIRKRAPDAKCVVFETGPLSVWFYHALTAEGLPALRTWGLKLREKIGFKRAAVAVARKLAVIMYSMLKSGELFDRQHIAMA